jgi:hypothetical protein
MEMVFQAILREARRMHNSTREETCRLSVIMGVMDQMPVGVLEDFHAKATRRGDELGRMQFQSSA